MMKRVASMLLCATCFMLQASLLTSCSKEETEAGEYDNWKSRNEAFFASLQDSVRQVGTAEWKRIKSYSLDPETEGKATDYIYAKVIESGSGTESPAYSDSVRVIYQGRLIPTANYPEGIVFDGTVYGQFGLATSYTSVFLTSGVIVGYSTALQNMHRGDRWRVYIPSELGYGDSENSNSTVTIPAYSVLILDLQLIDFSHPGQPLPAWSSRTTNGWNEHATW
mgnify:CR=1 FL=1